MADRLKFHVPEPASRPGQPACFDHLRIPPAGTEARPDCAADLAELRPLSNGLVRVLDDQGKAAGEWDPGLSRNELVSGLRAMMLTRAFDARMLKLQRQGRASFYMQCTGEEAVAVGAAMALGGDDMLFPSYRQQGLFIFRGYPLTNMMCQVLSNAGDPLKGRQMPVMYSAADHYCFSVSGNLGTQYPQAVGWAMASAIQGDTRIAASWVGEGTTAEADFHNALTFASVYRAPVVLNIVNNQYAISSFHGIAGGLNATFAARGPGYGVPGIRVDGNDLLAVHAVTHWAAERARRNLGPTLVELLTYRAAAHSSSDDPTAYRPSDEGRGWPLGDPVERLRVHLEVQWQWTGHEQLALSRSVEDEVRLALEAAVKIGKASRLDVDSVFDDVFEEIPVHLLRQRQERTR